MATSVPKPTMEVLAIAPGLWRWTAPHPEWTPEKEKPGGWGQMVGCVYYDPQPVPGAGPAATGSRSGARDPIVLFDPLAPPEGTADASRFWTALDRDIERAGAPVAILIGNEYHSRSVRDAHDRYGARFGASIWAHAQAAKELSGMVTDTFQDGQELPSGVKAHAITTVSAGEAVFSLPRVRALVFADALIGIGEGRARVAPASWAPETEEGQRRYREQHRPTLRRLLDLECDRLLVSHGPPILANGRRALEEALSAPAWGEP